jgi:hypothetical protein
MASDGILLGMGNPLLDISSVVDDEFLQKCVTRAILSFWLLRYDYDSSLAYQNPDLLLIVRIQCADNLFVWI